MRPRTGSVYHANDGRWFAAVTVNGKRSVKTCRTEEAARAALATLGYDAPRNRVTQAEARAVSRERRSRVFAAVIERGRVLGWSDAFLADVLASSGGHWRLFFGVSGPCVYCGDELADTVDHVVPTSRGGADAAENVVSCCRVCNSRKGAKPAHEFAAHTLSSRRPDR